ncbi:MAG: hypothetical protein CM15mP70_06600 [Pelagibacteraceae bacterium]|nr:MAG: hypothetical protein CM15mP70_06600 [Pelagibacteraceae bacterium]
MSGQYASFGEQMKAGAEMAVAILMLMVVLTGNARVNRW